MTTTASIPLPGAPAAVPEASTAGAERRHRRSIAAVSIAAAATLVLVGGAGAYAVTTSNLRADLATANARAAQAAAAVSGSDDELATALSQARTTAEAWGSAALADLGPVAGADATAKLTAALAALSAHRGETVPAAAVDLKPVTAGDWDIAGLQAAVTAARTQADRLDAAAAAPRRALVTVRADVEAVQKAATAVAAGLETARQNALQANPLAAADVRSTFETAGRTAAARFTPESVSALVAAYAELGRSQAAGAAGTWGGGGSGGGGWGGGSANGGGGGWGGYGGGWNR